MRISIVKFLAFSIFLGIFLVFGNVFLKKQQNVYHRVPLKSFTSTSQMGIYTVGRPLPEGIFYGIFFPEHVFPGPVPKFKFHVYLVDAKGHLCIFSSCGKYGEFVETMGGWLFGESSEQPGVKGDLGLRINDPVNPVTSAIVVSDGDSKIVGIYSSATMDDILSILRRHPDLADFKLLEGVMEFGSLKVGEPAPLLPGDQVTYRMTSRDDFQTTTIPKDKSFYVFAIQKRFLTKGAHCTYLTCDYIAAEWVWPNGWVMNDGEEKTARLFGLDPNKVREGKESLVVVTDSKGIIAAIHPGKTLSDTLSILRQLPEIYKE